MLNFGFTVKYLRLFNKLKDFNNDTLMKAVESVFKEYLGESIRRRLLRRVAKLKKTGKTEQAIRDGKWILTRNSNRLFARFVMSENFLEMIDKGGTITGKAGGWLVIPKDEHIHGGVVDSEIRGALRPGSRLYKKSFIKYYSKAGRPVPKGVKADYGIIMERLKNNKIRGLWIVKKSITIKPHHLFIDAISAAERDMEIRMRDKIAEMLKE